MAYYTIKDLERLSGIKAHTIRIWEKRYNLIAPARTSTGIRSYCDAELKKLLNVSILNKNGYKISQIAGLDANEVSDRVNKISRNVSDTESQIESLSLAMIDLNESRFEKTLSRTIIQLGFEDTVIQILSPLIMRIGLMWQTGTITPAQEHFVTNLIRQKLYVAIDSQINGESSQSKTFLLFLPEGEMHELGLLFANYLIRKRGHKVIYLGQSIPIEDIEDIAVKCVFDYLYLSFITSMTQCNIDQYIFSLKELFPEKPVFISGKQALLWRYNLPENAKYIDSPVALIEELDLISSG